MENPDLFRMGGGAGLNVTPPPIRWGPGGGGENFPPEILRNEVGGGLSLTSSEGGGAGLNIFQFYSTVGVFFRFMT